VIILPSMSQLVKHPHHHRSGMKATDLWHIHTRDTQCLTYENSQPAVKSDFPKRKGGYCEPKKRSKEKCTADTGGFFLHRMAPAISYSNERIASNSSILTDPADATTPNTNKEGVDSVEIWLWVARYKSSPLLTCSSAHWRVLKGSCKGQHQSYLACLSATGGSTCSL
jgi:hypothetical protein